MEKFYSTKPTHNKNFGDGDFGLNFESNIKAYFGKEPKVSQSGKVDLRQFNKCYELKTGAGELGNVGQKLLVGSSAVVYCPVVNMSLPLERQEAFVMSKKVFIQILTETKAIRIKKSSHGQQKVTIQTFWSHTKNEPNGKLLERMLDAFYNNENVMTLEEWLKCF